MADPTADIVGRVAATVVAEIFKNTLQGLREAKGWIKSKASELDVLGLAANKYAEKLERRFDRIHIFGMSKAIPLRSIFTQVNILEQITAKHRATVEE